MFPRPFDYVAPDTLEEALMLLAEDPEETKVLAGGHSLLPLMKLRLLAPRRLLDLRRVRNDLAYVRDTDHGLTIGALTTYRAIEADLLVRERFPALADTAGAIADLQVRNRGTIGGSLAHADPAADLPAVMLVLDVELETATRESTQMFHDATGFFRGPYETRLEPGELLIAVRLRPPPLRSGSAYAKFRNPASGYAVVGVAASLALAEDGRVEQVRLGVTGVGEITYRAEATETALVGQQPTADAVRAAAARAADGVEPLEDVFASAEYRAHLTTVYAERALMAALTRAQRDSSAA